MALVEADMARETNSEEKKEQITRSVYFYHYPIGNCPPRDVTLHCKIPTPCDVLLLGCGDIRFLLFTVDSIYKRLPPSSSNQVLNFHLNDIESGILGRALVLLYLVENIDPNLEEDLKFLWAVWYDVLLSKEHHQRLCDVMQRLETWVSGEHGIYFGTDLTRRKLVLALQWWQQYRVDAQRQVAGRQKLFAENYEPREVLDTLTNLQSERFVLNHSIFTENEQLQERLRQEIWDYLDYGVTRINFQGKSKTNILENFVVNPTMYRPYLEEWRNMSSSPFLCYNVDFALQRYNGSTVTMSSLFLEQLKNWVVSYQTFKQTCGDIRIHLWLGDGLQLLESGFPKEQRFDFMHTSNLSDRMGIIPLLVHCQEKLRDETGVLTMQTFDGCWYSRVELLLADILKMPLSMCPCILGLQIAEDLHLGHERVPETGSFVGSKMLTLVWKKAKEEGKMHLTGTDGISQFLRLVALHENHDEGVGRLTVHTKVKLLRRLFKYVSETEEAQTSDSDKEMNRVLGVTNSSIQQTVTEYPDRYEVTLACPPGQMVGTFDCRYKDGSLFAVVFTFTEHGHIRMETTVTFACAVSLKDRITEDYRVEGKMISKICKDLKKTHGSHILPRQAMTKATVSRLPDVGLDKFNDKDVSLQCSKICLVPANLEHPYRQLLNLVHFCMHSVWKNKFPSVCIKTDVSETRPGNNWKHVLVVDAFKMWETKPTLFVTWYNFDKARVLLKEGKLSQFEVDGVIKDHPDSFPLQVGTHLSDGLDLLEAILDTNKVSLDQSGLENPKWSLKTYLRPRYSYVNIL